ncbi:MAG: monovalent cation/H+ antiporter subunit D family protein [Rubrivivax sp.]
MSLAQHLPALQVVLPLLAAPLTVLLRQRHLAFAVVLVATWGALAVSVLLWLQVERSGTVAYAIGSWSPPWGIEYRIDRLGAFMVVLVCAIAAIVLPYSRASIEREMPVRQHYLYYTMFALCLTGLLGICITGDAFNIFVFREISSLATYVLIAMGRDRRALVAAYQYLIMGTIGATFFIIGVGLLYLMTGTLNLADMALRLSGERGTRPVLTALAFITVGMSLKLALFPLHQWLPNAYTYAPSAIAAFLAATATKVAVYVLLRFYFSVIGPAQIFERLPMQEMMLVLALGGMFVASAVAMFQTNLKRLFAYSSVAQIAYIILGLSFNSVTGLAASIVHMANHAMTKGALFMLLGGVAAAVGGVDFKHIRGLGRRMPLTSFGIVIGGLSLIGVPGTAGFISKWMLVQAAVQQSRWWLVLLIVLSSMLAIVYVWRFVEAAYVQASDEPAPAVKEAPLSMLLPSALMVAAIVYFGIDTTWTLGSATQAAEALMQGMRR